MSRDTLGAARAAAGFALSVVVGAILIPVTVLGLLAALVAGIDLEGEAPE